MKERALEILRALRCKFFGHPEPRYRVYDFKDGQRVILAACLNCREIWKQTTK